MTQNEKLQAIISMMDELRDKRYDRFFFDEEFDDCLNATVEQVKRLAEECISSRPPLPTSHNNSNNT